MESFSVEIVNSLTHYSLVLLFYTLWKHQKIFRFSDVFGRYIYKKKTPGSSGLNNHKKGILSGQYIPV